MFVFFFIGHIEVCQYKANVPAALQRAVRQRHAVAIKSAARIVGFLGAALALITPMALTAAQLTHSKISSDSLLAANVITVTAGLVLIGSFWLYNNAKRTESIRRKVARGHEREFYLSSAHYSFKLVFTPDIRKLINSGSEEGSTTYRNLYDLLTERSAISADTDILDVKHNDEVSYTKAYEAKALLIAKAELAVVSSEELLEPFGSFFADRRARLAKDFESHVKEVVEQLDLTEARLAQSVPVS